MNPSAPATREATAGAAPARRFLAEGLLLTAATFVASVGNFGFQFLMTWALPGDEFGVMNASLGLLGLLGVPMAAACQALAHFVARHDAARDAEALRLLRLGSVKLLRRWSGWLIGLGLVLVVPLAWLFGFHRPALVAVVAVCVPLMMWAAAGQQWAAGLSRFRLLAGLNITAMLARVGAGALLVSFLPMAESGVAASFFLYGVFALVMLVKPRDEAATAAAPANPWTPEFKRFLTGAMAVGVGVYLFTMGDILAANRALDGHNLDLYARAGLLGRAVVWGATPLLIVYFTRRSAVKRGGPGTRRLMAAYLVVLAIGAAAVWGLRDWLPSLLAGGRLGGISYRYVVAMTGQFATNMFFLGLLQAAGYAVLAARRVDLALTFGVLAVAYLVLQLLFGTSTGTLLAVMSGGALGSLLILLLAFLITWSRARR